MKYKVIGGIKMRKIVSIILVVIMMSVVLTGCFNMENIYGDNDSDSNYNDQIYENVETDNLIVDTNKIKIGDVIEFGRYEQDGNFANGEEGIEWFVLDIVDNKALLITKNVLDGTKYASSSNGAYWKESLVKSWLPQFEEFAFSNTEKNRLTHECLSSYKSVYCSEDNVFVLSSNEVQEIAKTVPQIYDSYPTEYAKQKGVLSFVNQNTDTHPEHSELNGKSIWWLRSDHKFGSHMTPYGVSYVVTDYDLNPVYGIRPSIWITIGEEIEKPVYGASSIDELNQIFANQSFNERLVETMTVLMQLHMVEEGCGGKGVDTTYIDMIKNNAHDSLADIYNILFEDYSFTIHINSYEKLYYNYYNYYSNEYNENDSTVEDIIEAWLSMCISDKYSSLYNEMYMDMKKEINHVEEIWRADVTVSFADGSRKHVSFDCFDDRYDPGYMYIYKINGRYFWSMIEII